VLKVNDIHKRFGIIRALDGVSFEISEGEAVGLIGPNAAGKTTLFNIISGLKKPDSGEVLLKGVPLTGKHPDEICRQGVGRTFQITRVFGEFTAMENVMVGCLFGRETRPPREEAAARAEELLEFVGLAEKRMMCGADLTLTQQRALELAMALATEPSILLLDEVAAGLSPKSVDRAVTIMESLRERGLTLLVIDHVLRPLMTVADRVIVMAAGKKITEGRPTEVAEDDRVIEAYLGERFVF
jgi:branched-chain amino acid transport system ATP-binding protein